MTTTRPLAAAAIAGLLCCAPLAVAPSWAAAPPGPDANANTLSWSVRPTPTDDEPNRPNFSFSADGGTEVADSIRVRNYGDEELALKIYASDARTTETGALDLLPASEQPTDVGSWITLERADVKVPAMDFVDVKFTMKVPENAESGDHTGGIVTSFVSDAENKGQPVKLDRRLGSRVQVRVAGELEPLLEVSGLTTSFRGTPNPLGKGKMRVSYTVRNAGNVRMAAGQKVVVKGPMGVGGSSRTLEAMPELLPGNSLTLSTDVPAWPSLHASTSIALTPTPVRAGDDFAEIAPAAASTGDWVVPWSTLALLAVGAGGGGAYWLRRRQQAAAAADLTPPLVGTPTR